MSNSHEDHINQLLDAISAASTFVQQHVGKNLFATQVSPNGNRQHPSDAAKYLLINAIKDNSRATIILSVDLPHNKIKNRLIVITSDTSSITTEIQKLKEIIDDSVQWLHNIYDTAINRFPADHQDGKSPDPKQDFKDAQERLLPAEALKALKSKERYTMTSEDIAGFEKATSQMGIAWYRSRKNDLEQAYAGFQAAHPDIFDHIISAPPFPFQKRTRTP